MPLRGLIAALLFGLPNCGGDETISGYADPAATYALAEIDGAAFTARATIRFPEEGRIEGQGPCNAYSASQSVPYPWFRPGPVMATKRACPDLAAETKFFEALATMTLVEVQGGILILSNEGGREMTFRRIDAG